MKYFFEPASKAVVALTAVMLACGCNKQKDVLVIDTGNLYDQTVTVSYNSTASPDLEQIDTLHICGNRGVWNRPIEEPTTIRIKPVNETETDVKFWMVPGEKASVKIAYACDGAHFYLKGSPQLKKQAQMHNQTYAATRQMRILNDIFDRLVQAENVDEQYADSLSEVYQNLRQQVADTWLDFIDRYPRDVRSAYYLINYGDAEVFFEKYETLHQSVKESPFARDILEKTRAKYERNKELEAAQAALQPGMAAPDFEAVDINGNSFNLSDLTDKYVVLDFWGTWCPWCVKGMPKMKEYHARYAEKVEFIGVDCRDKKEKLLEFIRTENIPWTQIQNGEENNPDLVLMYGVNGYPSKILLEPGGVFKARFLGEVPEFYELLESL